jgi:hypothetical protein
MKTRSFGNKCKCGHFESEHEPRKSSFQEPKAIPETDIVFTHPPPIDEPLRNICKICGCKEFHS